MQSCRPTRTTQIASRVLAGQEAPQLAAQQGKPSEYPPELKTEGEHKAYCFDWRKALEVHRRSNTTDATLHKIIAGVEAALDAAGAPAGTLVERIGALREIQRMQADEQIDGGTP